MNDLDRLLSLADAIAKGAPAGEALDRARAIAEAASANPGSPADLEKLIAALRRIDQSGRDQAALDEPLRRSPGGWAHLTISRTIGAGRFGTVYRAHDSHLALDVALELLDPSESPESRRHFLEAGRKLVRLRHPNVVRWYGVEESAGRAGMWSELVKGETLEQLVLSNGPLSASEATGIGRALCHAAAVIKQAGLPYPDILAGNVVRDPSGRVVLMEPMSRGPQDRTTADVVRAIGKLISYLATAIPAPLAAVIEQATSPEAAPGFATLDAFDSVLSGATPTDADRPSAPRAGGLWGAFAALAAAINGRGRRSGR